MKNFNWNYEKNQKLKEERQVCFEDVVQAINQDQLVDIVKHPNPERYPNQYIFIIQIKDYIYCVPFVEDESEIFLKTIYRSRKMQKKYLGT